jgi:Putative Ig domain
VITVTARDAADNTATDVITATWNTNVGPTLTSVPNQSSKVGLWDSLQLVAADANGDVLTYAATGLPAGLSINPATGFISPTPSATGTDSVTVTVGDGALSRSRSFTWTVRKRAGF